MLSRLFGLRKPTAVPDPDLHLEDVQRHLPDMAHASAAFDELQRLEALELLDVYLPAGWVAAGHRDFNVWLNTTRERITLGEWCAQWLAEQPGNGGAA